MAWTWGCRKGGPSIFASPALGYEGAPGQMDRGSEEAAMLLITIGALLVIGGVVLAATATLRRGRLSEAAPPASPETRGTLEPSGRGRRLSLKAGLPGLAFIAVGVLLLFVGTVLQAPG